MNIFIKPNYLIVIGLSFCFFLSACHKNLSREQSEKHLKAFDSELIMMVKQMSETNAFKALNILLSYDNLPLPFKYPEFTELGDPIAFDFQQNKGIYQLNDTIDEIIRCGESDSIVIIFPVQSEKKIPATFIITDYKEELSVWGMMFPTLANMKLIIEDRTLFEVHLNSEMAYSVPVKSNISASFDLFKLEAHLKTKLSKTKARINVDLEIFKRDEEYLKINSAIKTKITDQNSMLFNKVEIYCEALPIILKADVDYGEINSDSHYFVRDFNENSSIQVLTNKKDYLGEIKLMEKANSDRLNFVVEHNDKTFSYLEDYMLTFKEIMNTKIR